MEDVPEQPTAPPPKGPNHRLDLMLVAGLPVLVGIAGASAASDRTLAIGVCVVAFGIAGSLRAAQGQLIALATPIAAFVIGISGGDQFRRHHAAWAVLQSIAIAGCIAARMVRGRIDEQRRVLADLTVRLERRTIQQEVEEELSSGRGRNYVEREIARARRYNREVSVAIAEIDNLELLRAQMGASAVSKVLREFGRLIAEDTRLPDGGINDDLRFIYTFPETGMLGARIAMERLRLLFRQQKYMGADGLPLTVSIGLAAFPGDGQRGSDILEAAERAVQRAGAVGGNRTILSHAPEGAPVGWSGFA